MSRSAVNSEDLTRYLTSLRELKKTASEEEWLRTGWSFLETMGLVEFYGCDIDILPIIEGIPAGSDFVDVQCYLQHRLVEMLLDQLEDGGTTILLDTKKMVGTPAEALIPRIEELRTREISHVPVPMEGREVVVYNLFMEEIGTEIEPRGRNPVILDSLWLTAHGRRLLSDLGVGLRADLKSLKKIEKAINKLGGKLDLTVDGLNPNSLAINRMSSAMQTLLRGDNKIGNRLYEL